MIILRYSLAALQSVPELRETVDLMLKTGWTTSPERYCEYPSEFVLSDNLRGYVERYDCMLKMPLSHRQGEVYEGMPDRTVNEAQEWEEEQIRTLTRSEWKDDNFSEPFEHEGFVYVPHDIHNWPMNGWQIQVMVDNGCDVVQYSEYSELMNSLFDNIQWL